MVCDFWEKLVRIIYFLGYCFFLVLSKVMSFLVFRVVELKYLVDGIVELKSREFIGVFCKVWGLVVG